MPFSGRYNENETSQGLCVTAMLASGGRGKPVMPDRYEREIEDILRNIEDYRPKPSLRERLHLRRRRQARRPERLRPSSAQSTRHLRLSTAEWCFLAGMALGMLAAGIAYTNGSGNALSGMLAVLAFLGVLLGILIFWRAR